MRRAARRALAAGVLALAFLAGAYLFLPRLVDTEVVKGRFLSEVSGRVAGRLEASRLELLFSPTPRLVVQGARLQMPGGTAIAVRTATVHPRWLPLLRGTVRLRALDLDGLQASVRIPAIPFPKESPLTLEQAESKVAAFLARIEGMAPGASIRVRKGEMQFRDGKAERFRVTGLELRVAAPPSEFRVQGRFASDIGEAWDLSLRLDPTTWRGDGRLVIRRLRPGSLIRYLASRDKLPLHVAEMSATMTATFRGRGRMHLGLGMTSPSAVLQLKGDAVPLEGNALQGTLSLVEGGWAATVTSLSVRTPRAVLSGSASWEPRAAKAKAELRGRGLDVGLLRRVALALGSEVEGVRTACDVVRGGVLSEVSAAAQAGSPSDLLGRDTLRVRGSALGVALHLPWVGFDVANGAGEVEYQKGVLTGRQLSGETEGGTARESSLKIGFFGPRLPFHLDLQVAARLERVVPLLQRLVPKPEFQKELALLQDVSGTGSGRVVVGEWLDDLSVRVDAQEASVTCRYGRYPWPLSLRADRFSYAGKTVNLSGVRGVAGQSSFSGASGAVEWSGTPTFRFAASGGRASVAQLHSWLTRFQPIGDALKDFGSPEGNLGITTLELGGPLLKPARWSFSLRGRVEDFAVRSVLFPGTLSVRRGQVELSERSVVISDAFAQLLDASFSGASGAVEWGETPTFRLAASGGRASVAQLHSWLTRFQPIGDALKDFGSPEGNLGITSLELEGPLLKPAQWSFSLRGRVEDFTVRSVLFPGTLSVRRGQVELSEESVVVSNAFVQLLDSSVSGGGSIRGYRDDRPSFEASYDGYVGRETADWIGRALHSPGWLKTSRAVEVRRGRFAKRAEGEFSYGGEHVLEGGPHVDLSLRGKAGRLFLDRLSVQDGATDLDASGWVEGKRVHARFVGMLQHGTVDRLFVTNSFLRGLLQGDFTLDFDPNEPRASSGTGWLRVDGVDVPRRGRAALRIEHALLRGNGKQLDVQDGQLSLGGQEGRIEGRVTITEEQVLPVLRLSAEDVDGEKLLADLKGEGAAQGSRGSWLTGARLEAVVSLDAARFRYGRFLFAPFQATMKWDGRRTAVTASKIGLCGIDIPGHLERSPEGTTLEILPKATGADLGATLSCLGHAKDLMSGTFGLSAKATAQSASSTALDLLRGSNGEFSFKAENGRIQRFGVLAKVLAVLNLTEVLRGRLPDLAESGLGYRSLRASGQLEAGKLVFRESTVDASSMNLFWDGTVDLTNRQLDLTVIVSPLKTFDAIISRIPIVNYLLGRTLISVPVRVTGRLDDPTIVPLAPSAVGKGILGLMKRTLLLPYKLIEPLIPVETKPAPGPR